MVTAFNPQSFIKPPSHGTTTTPLKHTLDSQKPTSKQGTEITPHHSATPSTKTLPNLANTFGHSRTTTLTLLFHGTSYHLTLPTTAPVKDATSETYIGLTETDFKTRHRNHTASFRHAKHKNSTELSKHIWTLKNDNIDSSISWHVLSSNSPYNSSSKRCNLCLKENFLIIYRPDLSSLNKRNDLVPSCRHRNKALLRNS